MDRLTALLARIVAFFLFARVEVKGRSRVPRDRPVLLVASHLNMLLDPVLLASSLGRTPRFLAKSTLQKILGLGPLLRAIGVIFVYRPGDQQDTGRNVDAFAESHQALRARDVVAIFPEGTTHDRPRIEPVRTGAARIALGARRAGAQGVVIVPVGMTFTDKVALRGEALVHFGEPIELDQVVPADVGEEDRDAVMGLTAEIDRRLRDVSPDFPDVETWLALDEAAEVVLRTRRRPDPPLAKTADVARRLARAAPEQREAVMEAVGRYTIVLSGLRVNDRDVVSPLTLAQLLGRAVVTGLLVVLLGSLVGATILVNVFPTTVVILASLFVPRPVTKGTVRALVGLLTFPTAWITAAVLAVDGALAVTGLALLFAAGAVAAMVLVTSTIRFVASLFRWRLVRERTATLATALEIRQRVIDAADVALGAAR